MGDENKIGTGFFRAMHKENQDAIGAVYDEIKGVRQDLNNHVIEDTKLFGEMRAANETNRVALVNHHAVHARAEKSAWGAKEWIAAITALVIAVTALVKLFKVSDSQDKQATKEEQKK